VRTEKASTWVHQHCVRTRRIFGRLAAPYVGVLNLNSQNLGKKTQSCTIENITGKCSLKFKNDCEKGNVAAKR
jgi:hypothetical protein